ncbi:hypothetical protein E0Z10_g7252 [Xylaria hypoxylon]|uniref:Uncharacterized protein n=1 Tax=Xylaria hypoxylon TaxID=37992 RepID=A0A4Z0YSU0_9PEZI|nr:hypothetical protein E0Z10_g7252 [Xylaria hypoxylon]
MHPPSPTLPTHRTYGASNPSQVDIFKASQGPGRQDKDRNPGGVVSPVYEVCQFQLKPVLAAAVQSQCLDLLPRRDSRDASVAGKVAFLTHGSDVFEAFKNCERFDDRDNVKATLRGMPIEEASPVTLGSCGGFDHLSAPNGQLPILYYSLSVSGLC